MEVRSSAEMPGKSTALYAGEVSVGDGFLQQPEAGTPLPASVQTVAKGGWNHPSVLRNYRKENRAAIALVTRSAVFPALDGGDGKGGLLPVKQRKVE